MNRPVLTTSLALASLALATSARATEVVSTSLSAPIFPQVLTLYAAEGPLFPATPEGEAALVDASALTFAQLLDACQDFDGAYTIVVDPTTPEEIAANYDEIARCSYEQYTVKPYWIPALVDEVDICERTLGEDWHLLGEADVGALGEEGLTFVHDTLASVVGAWGWGSFYFSPQVYVRAADGSLAAADLTPGLTTPRIAPLPVAPGDDGWTRHYEAGLSLRCVKVETTTE